MKKIMNYSLTILSVIIFTFSLYIIIFGAIAQKNNTLLNVFGYSLSPVPTSSMEGTNEGSFPAGSLVLSKKVPYEKIEEEDVIIFQQDDILIIHRVIKINEDGSFTTQGDNNNYPDDDPVTKATYQAKMIKAFTFFGLGKKLPGYQLPVLMILILGLVIYLFVQLIQIVITINKQKLETIKASYKEENDDVIEIENNSNTNKE